MAGALFAAVAVSWTCALLEFKTAALVGGLISALLAAVLFRFGTAFTAQIASLQARAQCVLSGDLSGMPDEQRCAGELGDFVQSIEQLIERTRGFSAVSGEISQAAAELTELILEQAGSAQQQAAGLAEATATLQEIRQTSDIAAGKAETVIAVAGKAEESIGAGQAATEQSVRNLQEIQSGIEQVAAKIADLSERTQQVGGIIETVKDLADQSNMLALNASIEAVKAGDQGKGFGVVAREIRSLADQSIKATGEIRGVLTRIQRAIRLTVSMTEQRKADMERSMKQIRASGEGLREMNAVVVESSHAARQIAASVNQQNMGIGQISVAIAELYRAMEKTSSNIQRAEQAASNLARLSARITGILPESAPPGTEPAS